MILQVNQQGIETLKLVTKHGKVAEIQEHDVTVVTCMGSPQKAKKEKEKEEEIKKKVQFQTHLKLFSSNSL